MRHWTENDVTETNDSNGKLGHAPASGLRDAARLPDEAVIRPAPREEATSAPNTRESFVFLCFLGGNAARPHRNGADAAAPTRCHFGSTGGCLVANRWYA